MRTNYLVTSISILVAESKNTLPLCGINKQKIIVANTVTRKKFSMSHLGKCKHRYTSGDKKTANILRK